MVISKISGSKNLVSSLLLCACDDVYGDTPACVVHVMCMGDTPACVVCVVESVLLLPFYEFQGFNSGCWVFAGSAFAH